MHPEGGCDRVRPSRASLDPLPRPPGGRADLRRQGVQSAHHEAGRHQPPARGQGAGGQDRRAPQGRRPVRLRARRRGGGGAGRGRHPLRGRPRHHLRDRGPGVRRAFRSRIGESPPRLGIITGHERATRETRGEWGRGEPTNPRIADKIATGLDTIVFLMGVENLPNIVAELIENGRDPSTPVALVRWGTRAEQETLVGTLADIVEKVQSSRASSRRRSPSSAMWSTCGRSCGGSTTARCPARGCSSPGAAIRRASCPNSCGSRARSRSSSRSSASPRRRATTNSTRRWTV